jgi:REP element-mobilizing transposase RayT
MGHERSGRFYSRGGLPHWSRGGATQFLTWRLAGSVPAEALKRIHEDNLGDPQARARFHRQLDHLLDQGLGDLMLARPRARDAVVEQLLEQHARLYELHAFVVMPNHVHVLVTVPEAVELGQLVKRIKGASARAVNLAEGRSGTVWQPDYYDRVVRDDKHFLKCWKYIEWNPVKAGLCSDPRRFCASSAHPRIGQELLRRTEVRRPGAD